jgi:hypothetical protein
MEARSSSIVDMMQAVSDSVTKYSATVVSMSWGAAEFPQQSFFDETVFAPLSGRGVTFVAASGDDGTVNYPASSPYVLSIGGTALRADTESAWSNGYGSSGGGVSQYAGQPGYQTDQLPGVSGRAVPDVAYNADPVTGVPVLVGGQWFQVGGTSAGAPQWAGFIALANEARATHSLPTLSGYTDVLPGLYTMAKTAYADHFNDITSGGQAGPGHDASTGLGSPHVGKIIASLSGAKSGTEENSGAKGTGAGSTKTRVTRLAVVADPIIPTSTTTDIAVLITLGNRTSFGTSAASSVMMVQPAVLFRPSPVLPVTQTISLPTLTRGLEFAPVYLGGGGGGGGGREAAKPEQPGQPPRYRIINSVPPPPIRPPEERTTPAGGEEGDLSIDREVGFRDGADFGTTDLFGDDHFWLASENVSIGLFAGLVMGLQWHTATSAEEDPRRKGRGPLSRPGQQ